MLKRLLIRNLALIDEVSLFLDPGMNVLTGETGAGKSIIVDSVSILLGGKAERDSVRDGCAKAYVEGEFDISGNAGVYAFLQEQQIDCDRCVLTISREFTAQTGRSVYRVEGIAVSLVILQELTELLMDIHGQHAHQSLLQEKNHLAFLDAYGGETHLALLESVRLAYEQYRDLHAQWNALRQSSLDREDRLERLSAQEKELGDARVQPGEEEQVKRTVDQLRNAQKIQHGLHASYRAVYDGERDEPSAYVQLRQAKAAIAEIAGFDPQYDKLAERIESLCYEAEDIGLELRSAMDMLAEDQGGLQQAAERLDLLKRLSRRYGMPTDQLPEELERIREEMDRYSSLEADLQAIERKHAAALAIYQQEAEKLRASRQALALRLKAALEDQLSALNMKGTRIEIRLNKLSGEPAASGMEKVEVLLAANRGEEPRPLARIASGGELSRIMLAFKSIAAKQTGVPAMIFDEIDAGISGRAAQAVAEKMWDISKYHQVLCVTHLQQIAAMASSHFLVEKSEANERTLTSVRKLSREERIDEIARLIGGVGGHSDSAERHAKQMLDDASAYHREVSSSPMDKPEKDSEKEKEKDFYIR